MPPLSPYVPNTPQNPASQPSQLGQTGFSLTPPASSLPPHPSQSNPFSHQTTPVPQVGSIDYDWIVRFCFIIIIAPKLISVIEMLVQSVRYAGNASFSNTSSILNVGVNALANVFIFFVLLQFVQRERNYKKVLVLFLFSTIVMNYVARYGYLAPFKNINPITSTCVTTCSGQTPGSSCETSCSTSNGGAVWHLPSSKLK